MTKLYVVCLGAKEGRPRMMTMEMMRIMGQVTTDIVDIIAASEEQENEHTE